MTVKVQHFRTTTANKRPTPGSILAGEVALNIAPGTNGAFYKDNNGDIVKVGPAEVGSAAPNATPGAGGEAGNSAGEFWFDTANAGGNGQDALKVYNGSAWTNIGDVSIGSTNITIGAAATTALAGLTALESDAVTVTLFVSSKQAPTAPTTWLCRLLPPCLVTSF